MAVTASTPYILPTLTAADIVAGLKYRSLGYIWHVRAVVPADGIAVVRRWRPRSCFWHYETIFTWQLLGNLNTGIYRLVK